MYSEPIVRDSKWIRITACVLLLIAIPIHYVLAIVLGLIFLFAFSVFAEAAGIAALAVLFYGGTMWEQVLTALGIFVFMMVVEMCKKKLILYAS